MGLNLGVMKEPRGFIKVLQFVSTHSTHVIISPDESRGCSGFTSVV